jgi:hypothetical protein
VTQNNVGKQETLSPAYINLQGAESSGELSYWLSTTSTLFYLLQSTLKATSSLSKGTNHSRTSIQTSFRMSFAGQV